MGAMLCNQATAGNYVPTAASTTQTPCPSGSNSGVGASVCFQTGPSFVVNDASDTDDTACDALPGDCTLREAITAANNQAGANTITFDIPDDAGALCSADNVCTITLGALGTLPAIDDEVTIDGAPNNGDITVSGDNAVTVMTVNNGKTLSVNALTIVNGDTIGNGGGIFNGTGTLNVTNSTFSGNSAAFNGGAILNNGGTVNVTTSTFSDNSTTTAGAGNGGAIYNYSGTMNVMNSTFSGNSATNHGGGIYNEGTLNVTNSTFSGNSAAQGIGTYNRGTGNTVNVTNSTFSANTGTVSTSTVIFNQSGAGTTTLKNTIVAGNTVNFNCGYTPGGIAADSHNLVDFACDGAAIVGSIHLGPLQDNGGPTQTMALANNSPAIDAGDDTVCADNALPTSVNSLDQRGELRDDLNCDVGAFELRYGTTPPNSNTVTVQYNANNTRHSFGPALAIITPTTGAPIDFTVTITPSLYTTPVPPANALPIQWDARASTSPFSAFVTLCYDPGVLTGQDETTLHLYHYNGSTWVEFGGVLDNTTYAPDYHCIASATPLTSLSPLALAPNAPTATNVTGVKGLVNKNDNIVLRWKTTTETQIAGFNIYRQGKQGEWKQINAKFRQAKHAGAALGDKYRFIDRKANADKTYRYKIEIVYLDGHTEWTQVIRVNKP
jgi:CSLREA domain-containing protein